LTDLLINIYTDLPELTKMGFEQFDSLDTQAIGLSDIHTSIGEKLQKALSDLKHLNPKKDSADDITLLLTLIIQSLEDANIVNENGKKAVSDMRTSVKTEKEKIVGLGKTKYTYKCEKCSVNCEEPYRFKLNDVAAKICKMNADNSADYKLISQKEEV
jgi:hypothetical protein